MPAKKKTSQRRKKMVTVGSGDYAVLDLKSLNDLENRVKKMENKPAKKTSGVGSTLGRTLGSFLGNGDIGSSLGDAAEGALAKWFGHGDYELKSNSLVSAITSGSTMPKFNNNGSRGLRITEREYLGDVVAGALSGSATVFSNSSYVINPGNSVTFPWLSTIAQQFEQWEPNGIIFEFKSTSSTFNGSSQALGTVIMATDYDPTDPAYPNKIVMESSDYANVTKPSDSAVHGIECAVSERPLRLLNVGTGSSTAVDSKFSSMGNFQIATQGCSVAGVTLGELWVSYDITFYKKQLVTPVMSWWMNSAASVTAANPFSTTSATDTVWVSHNLPMTFNGKVLSFPPELSRGFFVFTYSAISTVSVTYSLISAPTNCTVTLYATNTTGITGYNTFLGYINVTGRSASFTFNVAFAGTIGETFVNLIKVSDTPEEYFE